MMLVPKHPKISIIIACLNAEKTLKRTLQSICSAHLNNHIEVLFADGGSIDNSKQLAYEWGANVLPGNDDGLYIGMNKGVKSAKGDFIFLLNADDELPKGAIQHLLEAINENDGFDIITGCAIVQTGTKSIFYKPTQPLSLEGAVFGVPVINARLIKRKSMLAISCFDENMGLAADRLLLVKLVNNNAKTFFLPKLIYKYHGHQTSKTLANNNESKKRILEAEKFFSNKISKMTGLEELTDYHSILQNLKDHKKPKINSIGSLKKLIKTLRLWQRWRGKMSGY